MKFNLLTNLVFQGAAGVVQFANLQGGLVPARYQWLLSVFVGIAQIALSVKAHFTNPDGSDASLPYTQRK
jgi:hypothetical protein